MQMKGIEPVSIKVDIDGAAKRLSRAVQFPTIGHYIGAVWRKLDPRGGNQPHPLQVQPDSGLSIPVCLSMLSSGEIPFN